jgi:nitronate monooxygenase
MSTLDSRLCRLFNIAHPVVLAPMGAVSGARLATAVSQAGGLGLIGASYGDSAWMKTELEQMREVSQPWGVGLVMFTVAKNMALLDLALEYQPHVVALSFGDAAPFVAPIKDAGALVVVQVHDVDQALAALDAGADALIVQGAEAGGHSLHRASLPLIPAVRDAVGDQTVLIAAGGVADGRGLAAALLLGADGVMMGTRFVASDEALPSTGFKQRVVQGVASDTVRTRGFDQIRGIDWPEHYSGRALANQFTERWLGREHLLSSAASSVAYDYAAALRDDNLDVRAIWTGEVVDLVRDILPAGQLVEQIVAQARQVLQRGAGRCL